MTSAEDRIAYLKRAFSAVSDSFQRIMVVKEQGSPWQNEEGTLVIGLKDFLLRPELTEPAAISPAGPTTAIDRNAALFDEVAPDLGSAFGSTAIITKLSKKGKAAK